MPGCRCPASVHHTGRKSSLARSATNNSIEVAEWLKVRPSAANSFPGAWGRWWEHFCWPLWWWSAIPVGAPANGCPAHWPDRASWKKSCTPRERHAPRNVKERCVPPTGSRRTAIAGPSWARMAHLRRVAGSSLQAVMRCGAQSVGWDAGSASVYSRRVTSVTLCCIHAPGTRRA
jgi:hypothetical protein